MPQVRFQVRSPASGQSLASHPASGAERAIRVRRGTLLIDAVREAGLPIASPCGDDLICGRCGVRVLEGEVTREAPIERDAKARNRVDPELRLACAVRVHRDLRITADYWGAS